MPVILTVKVQPKSSRPGVEKLTDREFRVRVRSAPDKGRANKETAELLASFLDVPASRLKLVRGASSSLKWFELE